MTAAKINRALGEAEAEGKNLYARNLSTSLGLNLDMWVRVYRAKTRQGNTYCKTQRSPSWCQASTLTVFDAR